MKKLLVFASFVDSIAVAVGFVASLICYYRGDVQSAIFWILFASFMGRGQVARFSEKETEE